ncbi:MAG: DoxX-like family protein [Bacteroidia bacterium]
MKTNSTTSNKILQVRTILTIFIFLVWLINGLFCKVLNLVPRHEEIVARILGHQHAFLFTKLIGISEILMALWIISRIKPRFCALAQVCIIAAMNTIEFFLAPDLLLFGKFNSLVALFFIAVIFYNESITGKKTKSWH